VTSPKRPAPDLYLAAGDDRAASSEVASLRESLMELRAVVGGLAPRRMSAERLPAALAEIVAMRREADDGVDRILTSAEAILAAPDGGMSDVHNHAIAILEACGFHDLVGQRLSKVADILGTLEARLNRIAGCAGVVDAEEAETASERLYREQTINGPALDGPDVLQSEIDGLFARP
jgi:chemotaxis protein CheZ